jgi:hypothetical protein
LKTAHRFNIRAKKLNFPCAYKPALGQEVEEHVHLIITALNPTGSDEEPSPVDLRVTNCTEPPCKFVRGKEIAAEVDFIPGE